MNNQVRCMLILGVSVLSPLAFLGSASAQDSTDTLPDTNQRVPEQGLPPSPIEVSPPPPPGEPRPNLFDLIPPSSPVRQPTRSDSDGERPYAYTLGPGDQIQIDIFNVPEFSGANGTHSVPADGRVQFPWIGPVLLEGLTISEAVAELSERYQPFINNPCTDVPCQYLTMQLLDPRPMRVNVTGEVNRPGVYVVGDLEEGFRTQDQTVTSAIQLAGGITQLADVREIEVYRPQRIGDDVVFPVNLWDLLQEGALEQDLVLRDGDRVVVPTASVIDNAEITELATANFSPDTIQVNVVGEVDAPGIVELPPNASMNQAILAAGGLDKPRARRSSVEFIRLNPDGTVLKRSVPLEFEDSLNEETNPALRNNDILIVRRSGLSRVSDFLGALTAPLNPFLSVGAFLRLFFE